MDWRLILLGVLIVLVLLLVVTVPICLANGKELLRKNFHKWSKAHNSGPISQKLLRELGLGFFSRLGVSMAIWKYGHPIMAEGTAVLTTTAPSAKGKGKPSATPPPKPPKPRRLGYEFSVKDLASMT
jgi:hypothetical protein